MDKLYGAISPRETGQEKEVLSSKDEASRQARKISEAWLRDCEQIEQEAKAKGIWQYGGLDTNQY